ncbi:MAG: hypothetical protein M1838_000291 [Thelocarpon superellum]|nr:MAG: hypothetical protein M1838_000291 [Thelocarpon superellum]
MWRFVRAVLVAAAAWSMSARAVSNGLAGTPQMGWDNWNAYGCNVTEETMLETGKKMVELGLRDLGYHYVILDDCWSDGRDAHGVLKPNMTKFPRGMKDIADSLHDMGLGFGMYSDAGSMTCGKYAGSLGHETTDAQTFAKWGVDYLKYDNCFNEGQSGTPLITYQRYKAMSDALNATGRPILYSLCNWGEDYPWKWAQTVANSWRMSGDIVDTFDRPDPRCPCSGDEGYNCALPGFHCSAMNILNKVTSFVDKGIPGAWNDLDALEVGNGGMSDAEYVTHFSMWAAVKSPLIMGNNLGQLTPQAFSILTNPAVIAISQDAAGDSAVRRWRSSVEPQDEHGQGEIQMWSGNLAGGDYLVVLLNAATRDLVMKATLEDIFWDQGPSGTAPEVQQSWEVYDLWASRMDSDTADSILQAKNHTTGGSGTKPMLVRPTATLYNATATPYAVGLAQRDPRVLGNLTTMVAPMGTLTAEVAQHSVAMFRLRAQPNGKRKRDEL